MPVYLRDKMIEKFLPSYILPENVDFGGSLNLAYAFLMRSYV